jgi:sec-independent protein translocase protein TatC
VFAYFLAKLDLITDKTLIGGFRYAIVIIFIASAILTPPDPATQFLMAIPLIVLYGVSILIVKMVNPYKEEENLKEE